jgi:predicted dehydrogenase
MAVLAPARTSSEVTVTAVAARDGERARAFAARRGIPRVLASYDELLADPAVDAVYVPLPNSLHGRWTLRALEAGKHVLCEKPFTANADEARAVADAAEASGLVVMHALHSQYHDMVGRLRELLAEGVIGDLVEFHGSFSIPLLKRSDIRFDLALGGGALMDVGIYPLAVLRAVTGQEPEIVSARARTSGRPGIDDAMHVRLRMPSGATATISCGLRRLGIPSLRLIGTRGEIRVRNFHVPQYGNRVSVRSDQRRTSFSVPRRPSSFEAQLSAFAGAVLRGEPYPTTARDAVALMRAVDACYTAAGLPPRQPAA